MPEAGAPLIFPVDGREKIRLGEFLSPLCAFLPLLSMITNGSHIMQAATLNDTQLVVASLAGDRQAFGQIVERYQNLVLIFGWHACRKLLKRLPKTNASLLLGAVLIGCGCQPASLSARPTAESFTLTNGIRVVSVHFPGSTNFAMFTYSPMSLSSDQVKRSAAAFAFR